VNSCPRCGDAVAAGQEYCVECGLRLPGGGAVGTGIDAGSGWIRRAVAGLVVAVAGAAVAVAASGKDGKGSQLVTATGGFATVSAAGTLPTPPQSVSIGKDWPSGQSGWTIVLVSIPQTAGRQTAVTRAREARARGLAHVGILDSSAYASLHPGYWIVFTGVYGSEAEATSALQPARSFVRTAAVRQVVQ
jgi:hypothetical protein